MERYRSLLLNCHFPSPLLMSPLTNSILPSIHDLQTMILPNKRETVVCPVVQNYATCDVKENFATQDFNKKPLSTPVFPYIPRAHRPHKMFSRKEASAQN